MKTFYELKH